LFLARRAEKNAGQSRGELAMLRKNHRVLCIFRCVIFLSIDKSEEKHIFFLNFCFFCFKTKEKPAWLEGNKGNWSLEQLRASLWEENLLIGIPCREEASVLKIIGWKADCVSNLQFSCGNSTQIINS
jgi:hypothetical protein